MYKVLYYVVLHIKYYYYVVLCIKYYNYIVLCIKLTKGLAEKTYIHYNRTD